MTLADLMGYMAAIGTTGAFIPQAMKVFRTKKTNDLSQGMYLLLCAGILLWIIYGVMIGSLPIIIANGVTFLMTFYILVMITKQKKAHPNPSQRE
jgi:MtN3 and saliva related transmembrane protein